MNYMPMPSLQHIALVKIGAALWNGYDVRPLIAEYSFPLLEFGKIDPWVEIEAEIAEKVSQHSLPGEEQEWKLPKHLTEKVLNIIKPLGVEILKWMEYHCRGSFFRVNLPNELCWTQQGTIDWKRTAHMLVRDESLDVTMRYKLACIYFLEDDIWRLWNEIPEARNNSFFYADYRAAEEHQWKVVCVWTKEIKKEWNRGMTLTFSYQSLIESCAEEGNIAAAEYFLPKLPPTERDISLTTTVDYARDSHVLLYLLCEMNDEQQVDVLKEYPYKVLYFFLNWPLQSFFIEIANRVWELLHDTHVCWLLYRIAEKINCNYKDCDYQGLFGELWKKMKEMSDARKNNVVGSILSTDSSNWHILQWLFLIEDEEKIREFFQMATLIQKKQFIFSPNGMYCCQTLIGYCEMRLFRLFFYECLSTKDELIEFFEKFEAYKTKYFPINEFGNLFYLLDDLISKYN